MLDTKVSSIEKVLFENMRFRKGGVFACNKGFDELKL